MKTANVLDETDLKILRVLQKEPNLTITEIGDRVSLSHTPCWRRIKTMESNNVIVRKAILLNPDLFNLKVSVFSFIKLTHHHESDLIDFEESVGHIPEIMQCYSMTGEYDYLLRIVTRSVAHYETIVKKRLLHLPSVAFINSSFALSEIKNAIDLPI